jgi:hypothetical protein
VFNHDNKNINNVKRGLMTALKDMDLTKPKKVVISDFKLNRTNQQRAWFHTLCGLFAKETGDSQGDIKEYIKRDVLGVHTVTFAGETFERTKSSEAANREEYSDCIEGIYRIAAEMGVILPEANNSE